MEEPGVHLDDEYSVPSAPGLLVPIMKFSLLLFIEVLVVVALKSTAFLPALAHGNLNWTDQHAILPIKPRFLQKNEQLLCEIAQQLLPLESCLPLPVEQSQSR